MVQMLNTTVSEPVGNERAIAAAPAVSIAPPQSRPELLAPAGDRACLIAAVENGADAVYFGLQRHNARARAGNFGGRAARGDGDCCTSAA